MAHRYMEKCSTSLAVREVQIKIKMTYHLTPAKMAIFNKSTKKQGLVRMWRKWNLSALLAGMQTGATTLENSMEILQKIKNGTAFDSVIPLLGIYAKNPQTLIQQNIITSMFIAALFTIAMIWKYPKCPPVDEWIKKLLYIYTMEYYIALKNKEFLPLATTWMELEIIIISKISQSIKDKYYMISLLESNEQNK